MSLVGRWVLTTTPPFFFGALTILKDGVATAAVFAKNARKLDDEDLAVVFNNIGGRRHAEDDMYILEAASSSLQTHLSARVLKNGKHLAVL